MPPTCYWKLKKDPIIQKFAKERVEIIIKQLTKIVDDYCKGSYEDYFAVDQPLYKKSNQRVDFMMNVYKEIIQYASCELVQLEDERDGRTGK
jgi:hypothetical protein